MGESNLGAHIDGHDFVLRFNDAPDASAEGMEVRHACAEHALLGDTAYMETHMDSCYIKDTYEDETHMDSCLYGLMLYKGYI